MREARNVYRVLIGKLEGKRGLGTDDIDNIEMEASCLVGTGVCFPGVERLRCDADHSPPYSAEVTIE